MKTLAFAALSMMTAFASASVLAAGSDSNHAIPHVASAKAAQTHSTMVYIDGSGHQHSLAYNHAGDARQNG
jgi:hypothetical protein